MKTTEQANLSLAANNDGVDNAPAWSVDNAAVLDLVPSGAKCVAKSKAPGTAMVSASATNSAGQTLTASKSLTVDAPPPPPTPPATTLTITVDSVEPIPATPPPASGVKIMPQQIAAARALAVANDPRWLAKRDWLDAHLLAILPGTYQALQLAMFASYAVGVQCARATNDAVREDQYGRKAAAGLRSMCRDLQYRATTYQPLATSDGVQKVFTLPDDPAPGSTVRAWKSPDSEIHNTENATLVPNSTWTGRTLTLPAPILAGNILLVEYVRADYSQTGSGGNPLDSIKVDSGYTSRGLRHGAHILDWCAGHPQVEALRTEATVLFAAWSDWARDSGYQGAVLSSNYGVGHYVMRLAFALATGDAVRINEVLTWRQSMLPQFSGPSPSLDGGFWPEGWNYGALSVAELIDCGLMLQQSGAADGVAELAFAAQVRSHLIECTPSPGTIIDLGDSFADVYPIPPSATMQALFARLGLPCSPDTTLWESLFFPFAPGPMPAPAGRHVSLGAGLVVGRGNNVWSFMLAGNYLNTNHQQYGVGHVEYQRGNDLLLVNEPVIEKLQNPAFKSQNSNTLVADDGGIAPLLQVYRFNQGFWQGTPGVVMLANDDNPVFMHFSADCKAAYSSNNVPGDGGSLSLWVRHWLLLKATGTVLVCDHYALKRATCTAEVRWNIAPGAAPSLSGSTFVADRGSSRLQGQSLSLDPVTATQEMLANAVPRIHVGTGKQSGTLVTVLKSGTAGTTIAPAVLNADGSVGVDGKVVTFRADGTVAVV